MHSASCRTRANIGQPCPQHVAGGPMLANIGQHPVDIDPSCSSPDQVLYHVDRMARTSTTSARIRPSTTRVERRRSQLQSTIAPPTTTSGESWAGMAEGVGSNPCDTRGSPYIRNKARIQTQTTASGNISAGRARDEWCGWHQLSSASEACDANSGLPFVRPAFEGAQDIRPLKHASHWRAVHMFNRCGCTNDVRRNNIDF